MHAFGYTGVNDATHRLESYGRMQFFSATFSETFLVPLLVHVQGITHNSNSSLSTISSSFFAVSRRLRVSCPSTHFFDES
jgi:hypothetical protein